MKKIWILGILFATTIILGGLFFAYDLQYINGVGRYISIEVDRNSKELELKASSEHEKVYTYQLSECSLVDISGSNQYELEEVLFEKIEMNDLLKYLKKSQKEGVSVYSWENYQIIQCKNSYVIMPSDIEYHIGYELLSKKNDN